MRILKTLILLFILAGISIWGEKLTESNPSNSFGVTEPLIQIDSVQSDRVRTNYKIEAEYQKSSHSIIVNEKINWKNIDPIRIDTLYLNLPASSRDYKNGLNYLRFKINSLEINRVKTEFEFIQFENRNFIDSSLIMVIIPDGIERNESLEITTQFIINLPEENRWSDLQFYNIENWYVTISPFIEGKFDAFPIHKYIETYLEYANYEVKIISPEEYEVALPGEINRENINGFNSLSCKTNGISRFNWFLFSGLSKHTEIINIHSKEIELDVYTQDGKDNYIERYVEGAKNYLGTLSEVIMYPFNRFTIVDIPNIGANENKSYPNIIALNTDLISPTSTQKFEYPLALLIAEQYFGNLINNNNLKEAWLSKGISSYIAEKLVRQHYGDYYAHFNIADFYPVYGLHFMSFAGIPLIYIVSDQVIPEGARYINEYYKNLHYANLAVPSYLLPNKKAFNVASVVKTQIALLTIEKMVGNNKFNTMLERYAKTFVNKYPTSNDFGDLIMSACSPQSRDFYKDLFGSDKAFDYAIRNITKQSDGLYEIMVERIEDGVIPIVLNVVTETDTIKIDWDGKDRFKIFTITSTSEVISAELDSENKNLFDLNFANNSYIVSEQYWGSFSYATRVFFWFQNALMLIGGKG